MVPPADGKPYQLWYGNQANDGTRGRYALLYANSTDGLHWEKPNLGIFDFSKAGFGPELGKLGTANNALVEGDGIGVYYDKHDPDPSEQPL